MLKSPARTLRHLLATLSLLATSAVGANPLSISNDRLTLTYDESAHSFAVAAAPNATPFLIDGRLEDSAGGAREQPAQDSVFGAGQRINVPLTGGGEAALEL